MAWYLKSRETIQIATTGHARTLNSPIGQYEFLQIKPELMQQGTVWSDAHLPYLIATAEKALIDTLYLSTRKNRRFARLPEVALEQTNFRMREFERLMDQLPIPPRICFRNTGSRRNTFSYVDNKETKYF